MGCGSSVDGRASGLVIPRLRTEDLLASIPANRALDDLADCVSDLHHVMPSELQNEQMRLIKITPLLAWKSLKMYEEVDPDACIDVPYADVLQELWDQTAVLSWRWGAEKPPPGGSQQGFTPMLEAQFRELCEVLTRIKRHGIVYVWIDWCCVPQSGAPSMVEVMRSKVFYARARAMVIIPIFHPLPADSNVRPLLVKAARSLKARATRAQNSVQSALVADVVNRILAREMVAGREYFSRVWTLVERMARHGRSEQLCNWLSLEAWLGMVVDAMLKGTEDKTASHIYKKILGQEAGDLLDSILAPLAAAIETAPQGAAIEAGSNMLAPEGLEDMVAQLFEAAATMWQSTSILDEAPTKAWLLSYMEEAHTGIYQAWNEGDLVWAVYSYFCWKQLDEMSPAGLLEALLDLGKVAGVTKVKLLGLADKLGILASMPVTEDDELFTAAQEGNLAQVEALIAAGANVLMAKAAEDNLTPLFNACKEGHLAVSRALVAAGADVNAAKTDGSTPLHAAAQFGHLEVMTYLLSEGANKEAKLENGATPLYLAAANGKVEAVKLLLEAGANMNCSLTNGWAPIHIASNNGHMDVVKALLEPKVDKDQPTKDGTTPLKLAAASGHVAVVRLLLEMGADKSKADEVVSFGVIGADLADQEEQEEQEEEEEEEEPSRYPSTYRSTDPSPSRMRNGTPWPRLPPAEFHRRRKGGLCFGCGSNRHQWVDCHRNRG